jgi:hypothetical protein
MKHQRLCGWHLSQGASLIWIQCWLVNQLTTAMQHSTHCLTASLSQWSIACLSHCITAQAPRCPAPLSHCSTVLQDVGSLPRCSNTPMLHNITVSLHYSSTSSLLYCPSSHWSTVSVLHCPTILLPTCSTASLPLFLTLSLPHWPIISLLCCFTSLYHCPNCSSASQPNASLLYTLPHYSL